MSSQSESSQRPLLVEREGAVETFVINDAPRNRMGLDFMDALEAEIERAAHDPNVRAIVIRGAGEEHFSVGTEGIGHDFNIVYTGIKRQLLHRNCYPGRAFFVSYLVTVLEIVFSELDCIQHNKQICPRNLVD